jgi:hypothetical protein
MSMAKSTYKEEEVDMSSFADFAISILNTNAFYKSKELNYISDLNSHATGHDIYQYANASIGVDTMNLSGDDPIIAVINELLSSKEYKVPVRRAIMLILYEKGIYPRYEEYIRLPSDITTEGTTHRGEPISEFIDLDISDCVRELEDGKFKLIETYPELEGVNFDNLLVTDSTNRLDTILKHKINDPVRRKLARDEILDLRELWRKVTTGPDRNYPLSHFIQKYDIINPTTLTRTKKVAYELLNKVLGNYHNTVLGLNSYN